jgi:hypothetical protein
MMEAYFDESGIHEGAKVCVVAGYYGSQVSWRRFEHQWNKVLADYPEIAAKGFHAKVFFGRDDGQRVAEYKGWSEDKANKFLERLLQTIIRNRIFPIGYGIVVKDFDSLPLQGRLWLTGAKFNKTSGVVIEGGCPSKSYYVPFQFCVLKAATKSNATMEDKFHCFAGIDRTLSGYADEFWRILRVDDRLPLDLRDRLGTIAFPASRDTPGIQAADLVANRLYKRALWVLEHAESDPKPLLMTLLKNWQGGPPEFKLMDAKVFAQMEMKGREEFEKLQGPRK